MQRRVEFFGMVCTIRNSREDRLYIYVIHQINNYIQMYNDIVMDTSEWSPNLEDYLYEIQGIINAMYFLDMIKEPFTISEYDILHFYD